MQNLNHTMKAMFLILAAVVCLQSHAQRARPVLSAGNHATLDSVVVSYRSFSTDTQQVQSMYVKPDILVVLKGGATVKQIFVDVKDRQNNTLLYSVSYLLSMAPYTSSGELLFSGGENRYRIFCPDLLPLGSYNYSIHTVDVQNNASSSFSTRQ